MGPGLAELATAAKRFTGKLVTVGWLDPRPAPYPSAPINTHRYMSFEHTLDPAAVQRIAAFLFAGLRSGSLRPAVDRVFTLDGVVDAHRYLVQGQQGLGKIVVTTGTTGWSSNSAAQAAPTPLRRRADASSGPGSPRHGGR